MHIDHASHALGDDNQIEQLARSNRELENFAAVVAHDLRSPLLTISGYCQLLQEECGDKLNEPAGDYLSQIIAGAARMNRLIEDLLEYSRAARAKQLFQRIEVASVVAQAIANLDAAIREHETRFEIGAMPAIVADSVQLTQVFQNLFDNAIKFHGESPSIIRVEAVHEQKVWRFSVADNGIGISREHFHRIFQTFQRLHGREYQGTGIGLAVCKKIVERHGGQIWLDSAVGQGSMFYFTIADRDLEFEDI
jgi:light-regulated signal transduction histidine kinase (bacteriophytochrome)